jgi:hypothetical protein
MDLSELQIRPQAEEGARRAALRAGATREELMEAIWVAAEMRAGAAYAHSALALDAMDEFDKRRIAGPASPALAGT